MPPVVEDGRAAAIIAAGYSSVHMVADLTTADLMGLNFLPGNAKKMASYLGSAAAARPPASVLMNNSVAASAQHSAQIGAAVAAAVTSANSKVQLFNSSDKRPTVSSAMRWAKTHLEKSNTGGFYLTGVIQLLIDDAIVDLSPHILVDPARTSDASYVREVLSSMTAEKIENFVVALICELRWQWSINSQLKRHWAKLPRRRRSSASLLLNSSHCRFTTRF